MNLSFACINNDRDRMEQAFEFRYEIFCEEKKFFDRESFDRPVETDLFDQYSFHFAAFDQFEDIKGYARLVCHSEDGYPMQHLCPYEITGAKDFIGKSAAEISRLAIATDFRTFYQDHGKDNLGVVDNEKKYTDLYIAPKIQIGLYRMMCAAALQFGITHAFAVMEESLYKRLSNFSLKFKPIGHGFENYGTVFPCLALVSDLKKFLFPEPLSPLSVLGSEYRSV